MFCHFPIKIPIKTSHGWQRGIYGSINLKKFMKPSFAQPKNISEDQTSNPIFFFLNQANDNCFFMIIVNYFLLLLEQSSDNPPAETAPAWTHLPRMDFPDERKKCWFVIWWSMMMAMTMYQKLVKESHLFLSEWKSPKAC